MLKKHLKIWDLPLEVKDQSNHDDKTNYHEYNGKKKRPIFPSCFWRLKDSRLNLISLLRCHTINPQWLMIANMKLTRTDVA